MRPGWSEFGRLILLYTLSLSSDFSKLFTMCFVVQKTRNTYVYDINVTIIEFLEFWGVFFNPKSDTDFRKVGIAQRL